MNMREGKGKGGGRRKVLDSCGKLKRKTKQENGKESAAAQFQRDKAKASI